MSLALGIDTGGTCTDAVLFDESRGVVASAKALTTHGHLLEGLSEAVGAVMTGQDATRITLVSVSTTLATNALVEGRGRPAGLVLIGYSPERLGRARLGEALGDDPVLFVTGGHAADGTEAQPLDLVGLGERVTALDEGVDAWAVSAMFATRNPAHERDAAAEIARLTGKPVSTGHRLSDALDAPRRALTALLNARLISSIVDLLDAIERLLGDAGIDAPLMVVKGDGTLIEAAMARARPVETILSGPAASVVGACHLANLENGVVVDIGGTTTDIATISAGRPRLSREGATVGGWPTRVEAIEIASIGLGGDSTVDLAACGRDARPLDPPPIGPTRCVPLALLASRWPDVIDELERQLERGYATSHDGEFVLRRPGADRRRDASTSAQRALLDRLDGEWMASSTLFADGSSPLALERLERAGHIVRAAFTPTDAAHVLGLQDHWSAEAARLGAQLAWRQRGARADDATGVDTWCRRVVDEVSRLGALAVARTALGLDRSDAPDRIARDRWLNDLLPVDERRGFVLRPTLAMPWIGLGASAPTFHPAGAALLGGTAVLPRHGEVANAVGAVVGNVHARCAIVLLAEGRDAVRVMLPDGPVRHESLELGAAEAERVARLVARDDAERAGAGAPVIDCRRDETWVEQDGTRVLLQCVVTATAIGRPRHANA